MTVGVYPGNFDPVSLGHLDIIKRSASLVDQLVIGVWKNHSKTAYFSVKERVEMLRLVTKDISNVRIETFEGLLIDFATKMNADIIIRGLRAVDDFENELQCAQMNSKMNPELETIFLTTAVQYSYLSSTFQKKIAQYGGNLEQMLTPEVAEIVYKKFQSM